MLPIRSTNPPFIQLLALKKSKLQAPADPWQLKLQSIKGHKGSDKVERIATEKIFDALDLARHERTPAAASRIKHLMVELGWTAIRTMDVSARGRATRVRGYARTLRQSG